MPSKRMVKAKTFGEAFGKGKDVTPYLDLHTAKVRQPTRRINKKLLKEGYVKMAAEARAVTQAFEALDRESWQEQPSSDYSFCDML